MEQAIAKRNIRRLRFLLLGIFLIEVLFLLQVERVRLIENAHELVVISYTLHFILAVLSISLFIFLYLKRYAPLEVHQSIQRLPLWTVFTVLILVAVISMFDQLSHGHITLFTVHLLTFGLIIYIRPYWNIVIYTIPYLLFIIGVFIFQDNLDILYTHLINATIIYVGVLFSSTVFYHYLTRELDYTIELLTKNEQLEILATIDPLTKLPNRRFFERQIAYEASINRRYNHEASLLLVDIDHFKTINDNYGHDVGDEILKELSEIFKSRVRESDTVARWGGEEFMFLLSHTTPEGARILADRIRVMVQNNVFKVHGLELMITISIGITRLNHEIKDGFKDSYKEVDQALYEAKDKGRNRVIMK
ncbi:MAG: GGDEF domain-containing protein [Candidatus Izemoplasmataceae bacterium]